MRVELAKLHDQLNATMIYVTHDQTEAMTLADDIVVLDEGIVSQNGSPMEMYNNPKNLFVGGFIGSPKMNFIPTKIVSTSNNATEIDLFSSSKISVPKTSSILSNPLWPPLLPPFLYLIFPNLISKSSWIIIVLSKLIL